MLTQSAQPVETDEPRVPHIQEGELCVRNAVISLMDQAWVQNIKFFSDQDREHQKQPTLFVAVDQLTDTMAGQLLQQQAQVPARPQQVGVTPPPPADDLTGTERMDMDVQGMGSHQDDVSMGNRSGVHKLGSMGLKEVAKET